MVEEKLGMYSHNNVSATYLLARAQESSKGESHRNHHQKDSNEEVLTRIPFERVLASLSLNVHVKYSLFASAGNHM